MRSLKDEQLRGILERLSMSNQPKFLDAAAPTKTPHPDWALPVGSVITFRKHRIMPGDDAELYLRFFGVVVSGEARDIREDNGMSVRMDYVVLALACTDFKEPSLSDVQTFVGIGVVREAALRSPTQKERVQFGAWLHGHPQHDVWFLFDHFDGQAFIPNAAFANRSLNDICITEGYKP